MFGCCKALCGAKPIPAHFRTAYTTVIMNNLIGPVSENSNCEEDSFFALLSNINEMLLDYDEETERTDKNSDIDNNNNIEQDDNQNVNQEDVMLDCIVFDPLFGEKEFNFIESESISNTSGTICRKLIEITTCEDCEASLQESDPQLNIDELDIIFPSKAFKIHFEKIFHAINTAIPHFCSEKSVKKKIISQVENIHVDAIGCEKHCKDMAIKLKELIATFALSAFCNTINNTLSGKISNLPAGYDHIQEKAFLFRKKKRGIGKHSDIFIQ